MSSFLDTIDEHWWLGLPAAISFFLAHFIDFTAGWATVLYWFLFGLTVFSIVAALVVGLVNRNTKRKDLVKPSFWYPWPFVIPVCITFVWMPDNSLLKGLLVCYLASLVGLWSMSWKYYFLKLHKSKGRVPGRGK